MVIVAVLAGGRSPEHDVSVQSGSRVLESMSSRWHPWPVLLDRDGMWWPAGAPAESGVARDDFRWPSMRPMSPGEAIHFLREDAGVEVTFPVLHGPGGEDGSVQGMLELHDMPFVGSSSAASAAAMDKIRTRECLGFHGVAMPPAVLFDVPLAAADAAAVTADIERGIGFPCFLKTDLSGSSLGVARVETEDDVAEFLVENRHRGRRFFAEAEAEGEEITVAVLGNTGGEVTPLPPVGIYPRVDGYFTYAAKYTAALCEEIVPPRGLDGTQIEQVQRIASQCHTHLCCDGMSRVDMIFAADGPLVLEVNTIPGLTDVSLLPRAAGAAGIDFSGLIDRLLELALARAGVGVPA